VGSLKGNSGRTSFNHIGIRIFYFPKLVFILKDTDWPRHFRIKNDTIAYKIPSIAQLQIDMLAWGKSYIGFCQRRKSYASVLKFFDPIPGIIAGLPPAGLIDSAYSIEVINKAT
jgi:hypothetical protein